jgi:hypothetical protein
LGSVCGISIAVSSELPTNMNSICRPSKFKGRKHELY